MRLPLGFSLIAFTANLAAIAQPATLIIKPNISTIGIVGKPLSIEFTVSGGIPPYSWGVTGSLPPGITQVATTGAISGTPTSPGDFSFAITAVDAIGNRG